MKIMLDVILVSEHVHL